MRLNHAVESLIHVLTQVGLRVESRLEDNGTVTLTLRGVTTNIAALIVSRLATPRSRYDTSHHRDFS